MSKIFKICANIGAAPFVMEDLGERAKAAGEPSEDIGGSLLKMEKEAYELGFKAGEKAGFDFGRQKAEVLFSGLAGLLDEISNLREGIYRRCENEMAELSLAIARKVIQTEIETRKDVVLGCVKTALKVVSAGGEVLVKVNPKDLEVLISNSSELARHGSGIKGLKVEGDEAVSRGGCVIDTHYGEIDSTIESVMSEIEEKLKDAS